MLGALWVALVRTQIAAGEGDGSGSADGTADIRQAQRQKVVVVTFLAIEILVRPLTARTLQIDRSELSGDN